MQTPPFSPGQVVVRKSDQSLCRVMIQELDDLAANGWNVCVNYYVSHTKGPIGTRWDRAVNFRALNSSEVGREWNRSKIEAH